MFKKIISALSAVAILAMSVPVAFSEVIQAAYITSVSTVGSAGTSNGFDPGAAEELKTTVTFDTANFQSDLNASSGHVKVVQGSTTIKTLVSWDAGEGLPAAVPNWDGKSVDTSGQAVCGNAGAICPTGDYTVEVYVQFDDGTDVKFDKETKSFQLLPEIHFTSFAVSPTTFNPVTQTADASFNVSKDGFFTVEVLDGTTVIATLVDNANLTKAAGPFDKNNAATGGLDWNGINKNTNQLAVDKTYKVRFTSRSSAAGSALDVQELNLTVSKPSTLLIEDFSLTKTSFDPSTKGQNESVTINYQLNSAATSLNIEVRDDKNDLMKNFVTVTQAELVSGSFIWDGEFGGKIVEPGTYTVKLIAKKTGEPDLTSSKNVSVAYNSSLKPNLQDFKVTPTDFDPDVEDSVTSFKNEHDADITVEILNKDNLVARSFVGYKGDNYSAGKTHSIAWNGKDNNGAEVTLGAYTVKAVARNEFGVVVQKTAVNVNNSGGSVPVSNAHIGGIDFSPTKKFDPAEDDELEIQFDVKVDLDEMKVYAVRGTTKLEIESDTSVDKENNVSLTWDALDDDDEYVEAGTWNIRFETKKGTTSLVAQESITVEYEKPVVDDLYLSKDEIDPDQDEFTSILFRIDADALVDVVILESGSEDDKIVEEMDVEKDKWYAVEWDGNGYDENDDVDIQVIARNTVNEDVYDTEKIGIELKEDDPASSKSNVTQDYISPVITDGNDNMSIFFNLEEEADVQITIHKGTSASGSKVAELVDEKDVDSGDREYIWNGKSDNGDKLAKGVYTYKIVSKKTSSETETGLFVVGTIGEIDGTASGDGSSSDDNSSSSSSSDGKISSNIISINGQDVDGDAGDSGDGGTSIEPACGGFTDVQTNSPYCDAIDWVAEEEIFVGYGDGTFKPKQAINRAETAKVVLEGLEFSILADDGTNLGFSDVQVGAWYMRYIKTANNLGVIVGDGGKTTVRPADTVNRAELLKIVIELLKKSGSPLETSCNENYADVDAGVWFASYGCVAKDYVLFDGNVLSPSTPSTRGEVAEVLYRLHLSGIL